MSGDTGATNDAGRIVVLGVTGTVAGGKSAAAQCLAARGAEVIELDGLGHELLAEPAIRAEIDAAFPEAAGETGAAALRRRLAGIVFADPRRLERLERILHPRMCERVHARIETRRAAGGGGAIVICGALVYEMGLDAACDRVVVVDAPDELRRQRAQSSRGWDREELERRESRQLPAAVKRGRAWRVVDNSGTREDLDAAMAAIWRETKCL